MQQPTVEEIVRYHTNEEVCDNIQQQFKDIQCEINNNIQKCYAEFASQLQEILSAVVQEIQALVDNE